jgi:hypothetical protein
MGSIGRWAWLAIVGIPFFSLGQAVSETEPVSTAVVGQAMRESAAKFIGLLDEGARAKAMMPFDDPRRVDWHNIPKPTRKGIQLREMTPAQSEACHELLRAALSESGYAKARDIMALENNLREGEKSLIGGQLRDPLRYFLTIFGEPGSSGRWCWSFEGHHFSLNFVIDHDEVVAESPSFWGANPATVHVFVEGGPAVGARTLAEEEQLALDLVASWSDAQRARGLIESKAPAEYRGAGVASPPRFEPTGLVSMEMTSPQRRLLESLLKVYTSHWAGPIAENRMRAIRRDGLDKIYFAWAGSMKPGVGHYYRVQGPSFVLELVNVQSDPAGNPANHIHSVWRNPAGDFGLAGR